MPSQDGSDGQDGPWGNRSTPPDIDDLLRQRQAQLKQLLPGGGKDPFLVQLPAALAALNLGRPPEALRADWVLPDAGEIDLILNRSGLNVKHWRLQTCFTQAAGASGPTWT